MRTLSDKELRNIKAFVRATDYLSVAQLYLKDNPLLKEKLTLEHIKPNVVGHWGTAPGQNFVYAHLNRIIKKYKLDMIYVSGPGHGGQAMIANTNLEGSYTEVYPKWQIIYQQIFGIFFSEKSPRQILSVGIVNSVKPRFR